MRVRIIASKPRISGEAEVTELIGESFNVIKKLSDGRVFIDHESPLGFQLYPDEYEVVEQKEAPGAVTP